METGSRQVGLTAGRMLGGCGVGVRCGVGGEVWGGGGRIGACIAQWSSEQDSSDCTVMEKLFGRH